MTLDFDTDDDDEPRTIVIRGFGPRWAKPPACPCPPGRCRTLLRAHGTELLMLILAIDTSAVASAALVSDDAPESVVGSFATEDTRSHAEVLAPGIETCSPRRA